jgi:hypothetical protein
MILQHVPASRDGKQRRQAAALDMLRGYANARLIGSRFAKHLRPAKVLGEIARFETKLREAR